MKRNNTTDELELRAIDALRALLGQVSVIKVKEIRRAPKGPVVACLEVLGHKHLLACEIEMNTRPESLRSALDELCKEAASCADSATPLIIAPFLSPEAQALCKERSASYLDLEGNARVAVGEVFISKRSLQRAAHRAPAPAFPPQVLRSIASVQPGSVRPSGAAA